MEKPHEYFPIVDKKSYSNFYLKNFLGGYFGGSFQKLVSFFAKENEMDIQDFESLMKHVKSDLDTEEQEQ